jgi:hypothetical protein
MLAGLELGRQILDYLRHENAGDPTADEIINYLEEQRLLADYYHRRQERPDYYQNRRARE